MPPASHALALVAGRSLLALVFLASGLGKILSWNSVAGYMASREIPWSEFFLGGAIALELGGSLSLLLGWKARIGARALILVLIPATLAFHGFWHEPDAEVREQMLQFLKNLSILGGLLLVSVHGAGPWSLDNRR